MPDAVPIDPDYVARLAAQLPGRCREVIRLRYGLEGSDIYSVDEVARILKVTRERARQVEGKGLDLLVVAVAKGVVDPRRISKLLQAARMRAKAGPDEMEVQADA